MLETVSAEDLPREPTDRPCEPVQVMPTTVVWFAPGLKATQSSSLRTVISLRVTNVEAPMSKPRSWLAGV